MSSAQGPIRILIIDDDEDDYLITSNYIRYLPGADFVIDWCQHFDQALELICRREYDLYFTDYRLGARSGVDLLTEVTQRGCDAPIILLTGKGNREIDMKAMQLGAVDYLVKADLTMEKMERCIRYTLERVEHMRALKANERKYRSIFEKSKDLVFLTDHQLNFKEVNGAAMTLLGYEPAELLSMNLCDLLTQAQHKRYLQNTIQARKILNDWEVVLKTKNGEQRVCMLTAAREGDTSEPQYVQGILHDITMLRKEEKVTLQAEKLAATGRLVRALAHEVRNPLNNITLSVEQMQQDRNPDENTELYLDIIQRNAKRISLLINELLNSSRQVDVIPREQVFQTLLDDVLSAAMDRIMLKKIHPDISYPDEPIYIRADAEKLKLALLNVVINAIEAMEEGKGVLQLHLERQHHRAILKIGDNGCGISEEHISRLFEPYFTQKRNGMGLGLAFVLNILQGHKASIDVVSSEGVGTLFTMTFPLIAAEHTKTDAEVTSQDEELA
jgi:PAS domain S-box-containing protein